MSSAELDRGLVLPSNHPPGMIQQCLVGGLDVEGGRIGARYAPHSSAGRGYGERRPLSRRGSN